LTVENRPNCVKNNGSFHLKGGTTNSGTFDHPLFKQSCTHTNIFKKCHTVSNIFSTLLNIFKKEGSFLTIFYTNLHTLICRMIICMKYREPCIFDIKNPNKHQFFLILVTYSLSHKKKAASHVRKKLD